MSVKDPVKQTCTLCGDTKLEDEYYRRSNGDLRSQCKKCWKIMNKIQRQRHIKKRQEYDRNRESGWERSGSRDKWAPTDEQNFANYLKRVYDITSEQFWAMHTEQDDRCAICRQEDTVHPKLSVDHDHESGEVRGLLCFACNTGIGKLGDSFETVQRAADYLNPENR